MNWMANAPRRSSGSSNRAALFSYFFSGLLVAVATGLLLASTSAGDLLHETPEQIHIAYGDTR